MKTAYCFQLLKRSPLARAVYLLFFLIALIPALILSFFSYSAGADVISRSTQEFANNNLQEAYLGIRSAIDNIDTMLFSLTIDDRIMTLVRQ